MNDVTKKLIVQLQSKIDQMNEHALEVWNVCGKNNAELARRIQERVHGMNKSTDQVEKLIGFFALIKMNEIHMKLADVMDEKGLLG